MLRHASPARRRRYSVRHHNLAERIRGHAPSRHQPPFAPIDLAVMAGSDDPWLKKLAELANKEEAR